MKKLASISSIALVFLFVAAFTPSSAKALTLTRTLAVGSKGTDVVQLQSTLVQLGYLQTTPTGYFGVLTKKAVAAFQSDNGLTAVGYTGPKTRVLISNVGYPTSNTGGVSASSGGGTGINSGGTTSAGVSSSAGGSIGTDSASLTGQLQALQAQLAALQGSGGISSAGASPTNTSEVSTGASNAPSAVIGGTDSGTGTVPTINRTLFIGATGNDVTILQQALNRLGYLSAQPTGYFGSQTSRAIAQYQQANGLEPVGFAGRMTRTLLNQTIQQIFGTSSTDTTTDTSSSGSTGNSGTPVDTSTTNSGSSSTTSGGSSSNGGGTSSGGSGGGSSYSGGGGGGSNVPVTPTPIDGSTTNPITASTTMPVTPPNVAPTLSFTISTTTIANHASTTLKWSSQRAQTCTATGSWSGPQPTNGTKTFYDISSAQVYTLTCSGTGSVKKTVAVSIVGTTTPPPVVVTPPATTTPPVVVPPVVTPPVVTPKPTLSFFANPVSLTVGSSTTLSWSSSNASSCIGTGFSTNFAKSGSQVITPSATTTYALSCAGASGVATSSVTVGVHPKAVVPVTPPVVTPPVVVVPPTPPATSGLGGLFVYKGNGSDGRKALPAFEKFLGRKVDGVVDFVAFDNWTSFDNDAGWGIGGWKGSGYQLAESVPLTVNGTSLATVASGKEDAHYTKLAQTLISNGYSNAYIRLGWEFNGGWYPWAFKGHEKDYSNAYRDVVMAMRAVPGAHFTFVWNPAMYENQNWPDIAYPGDDVVDVIATDAYNSSYTSGTLTSPNVANEPTMWSHVYGDSWGIKDVVAFAKKHNKPYAFPEWATGNRPDGHGGGDDAYFIQKMAPFVNGALFSGYWDFPASDYYGLISGGKYPAAAAEFLKDFGGPGASTTPVVPPVVVPPVVTPKPALSFMANPVSINIGSSTTLTWSSANASACNGTGFATNAATSGTRTLTLTATTTFALSCVSSSGEATSSITVGVHKAPIVPVVPPIVVPPIATTTPPVVTPPVVTPPSSGTGIFYITPNGNGTKSGSSWANAGKLAQLPDFVSTANPGDSVWIRADQGAYHVTGSYSIYAGGTAGHPVTVMGVDVNGNPMNAEIDGTRTYPWKRGGNGGSELFRLLNGSNYLTFSNFYFRNIGNGAFRFGSANTGTTIQNIQWDNVERVIEDYASGNATNATITNLTVKNVTGGGTTKGMAYIGYDSNNILFEDVSADGQYQQDGNDDIAEGVALLSTAHDITFRRVTMKNMTHYISSNSSYLNGDGFSAEGGNYNLTYDQCTSTGNTDGGFDLKSKSTTISNSFVSDNKRNLRIWGTTTVIDTTSSNPRNRGGSGAPSDVYVYHGHATLIRPTLITSAAGQDVFDFEGGDATVTDGTITSAGTLKFLSAGATLTFLGNTTINGAPASSPTPPVVPPVTPPIATTTPPVTPAPAPTVTLSVAPTTITSGDSAKLSWSSTNANSCSATGFSTNLTGGSTTVSPTATTTYSINCTGAGGSKSATVTLGVKAKATTPPIVTPPIATPAAPVVRLSAAPSSITSGATVNLSWTSTNSTSCSATGFSTTLLNGSVAVTPTATTNYAITCTGAGGTNSASVTVTVAPKPVVPAPILSFTTSTSSITSGGSATLTWSATDASACTASGGWGGTLASSGSKVMSNITAAKTYTLACTGAGGSVNKSVSIVVKAPVVTPAPTPAPTLTLTSDATSVVSGSGATLSWSSTNASTCTASGSWTGSQSSSGTKALTNLTSSGTYSLACTGAGGNVTKSVAISVTQPVPVTPAPPTTNTSSVLNALLNNEVFLQGTYLNIGINKGGSLGTVTSAPSGFVTNTTTGFVRLGMMEDNDGFNTGAAPTVDDLMLKGTPTEGFAVAYSTGSTRKTYVNHDRDGYSQIPGTNSNASSGSKGEADWNGSTPENVKVSQAITLGSTAKYVRVSVTLTNNGSTDLTNVRYMRTIDPDQGMNVGNEGNFNTINKIVSQGPGRAVLAAYTTASTMPFFYYAPNSQAVVSVNTDYEYRNPDLAAAYDSPQATGYSLKGDDTDSLTYSLGTLAAGSSKTITFYMGVTDDLTGTLNSIDANPVAVVNTKTLSPIDRRSLMASLGTLSDTIAALMKSF